MAKSVSPIVMFDHMVPLDGPVDRTRTLPGKLM